LAPRAIDRVMRTSGIPPSVQSIGTTASAPSGSGAPVIMRIAAPSRSSMLAR
jgi:hypothetical protein